MFTGKELAVSARSAMVGLLLLLFVSIGVGVALTNLVLYLLR